MASAIPGPQGEAPQAKPKREGRETSSTGGAAGVLLVGVVAAVLLLRNKRR